MKKKQQEDLFDDDYIRIEKPTIEEITSFISANAEQIGFDTIQYKTISGRLIVADSRKYGSFLERKPITLEQAKRVFKTRPWHGNIAEVCFIKEHLTTSKEDKNKSFVFYCDGFVHFITIYNYKAL